MVSNVGRSAATTDTGASSGNTSGRSGTPQAPFLCKIMNCGQSAFSEVPGLHFCEILLVCARSCRLLRQKRRSKRARADLPRAHAACLEAHGTLRANLVSSTLPHPAAIPLDSPFV